MVAIAGPAAPVEEIGSALVSRRSTPQIISVASPYRLHSDFVLSQHGLDVEHSVFDEGGAPVVVVELEFPVASAGQGDVMLPLLEIEELEVIGEDEFGLQSHQQQRHQSHAYQLHCLNMI